jgi:dihydrolipoamide dehydrogenase
MAERFDVTVLGAGPGGYIAAIRAAQLGLRTAIIEKKYWGGICLNVGCIPSKVLLKNAEVAHLLQHRGKEFGFTFNDLTLDYEAAYKRSRQVSDRLARGVQFLMRKNNVEMYDGWGTLVSPNEINVELNEGETNSVQTDNLIIATGAHSRTISGVDLDGERVVDYEQAILFDALPKSAVIIGAGPVGVEFAYVWRSYGLEVTLVEMLSRMLPLEDEELGQELAKAYKKLGIDLLLEHRVEAVDTSGDGVKVKVSGGDQTQTLEADMALVAIGFAPNLEGYGLENLNVEMAERTGFIQIDERMRTNVSGVYAIGDVTGKLMLAHVASAQGVVAAETIAGHPTMDLEYVMMPRAVYCQPQVAAFGLTRQQAEEQGYEVNEGRFPFQPNGKALALGERTGFVKVLADAKYGEILGAHMIGPEVTELLPELVLAHNAELTPHEIARSVHAHPTLSEALSEAAHDVEGEALNI